MTSYFTNHRFIQKTLEKSYIRKMAWIEPKYTKGEVDRAGETLRHCHITDEQYSDALNVVNNWRSSYAFSLKALQSFLRKKTKKIDKKAFVTQRLKRIPSIISKLKRYPTMKFHRMQDIGGCRAVVEDLDKVYKLRDLILNSTTNNKLIKEHDYIKTPQKSGYRSLHLIYQYRGYKEDVYDKHLIELQIRTKTQHAWATTVEIVGTFLKQSLKAGEGTEEWLNFFELVSVAFASLEGCQLKDFSHNKIKEDVDNLIKELDVYRKLEAFSISTQNINKDINKKRRSGYFLLSLDILEQKILVFYYDSRRLEEATKDYIDLEKEYRNNKNLDVVLVAAQSIQSLEKAYPNYFADSEFFLQRLNEFLTTPYQE